MQILFTNFAELDEHRQIADITDNTYRSRRISRSAVTSTCRTLSEAPEECFLRGAGLTLPKYDTTLPLMRRPRSAVYFFLLCTMSVILSGMALACAPPPPSLSPFDEAVEMQTRVYEGQALSSVEDFRENSIAGPRHIDPDRYSLRVTGLVENELILTYDAILTRYASTKKLARLQCIEGWDVTVLWEGVLVQDLLEDAAMTPEAEIVIFRAADGYSTSLFIDYLYENDIIMAHSMNDVTLPAELGFPFQLVAESKWGYKWIKWITSVEVSDDVFHEGYWEQRGFSDVADVEDPFLS